MDEETEALFKMGDVVCELYVKSGFGALSADQQRFFLVYDLAGQVGNGGILQYFDNSTGHLAAKAADALDDLGVDRSGKSIRSALARFPGEMPPTDWEARRAVIDSLDESVGQEWDELSKVIFDEMQSITQRRRKLVSP